MSSDATQLPLTLSAYNNQSLFSDHYLDEILRRTAAWNAAIPEAHDFLTWLRDLYNQEKAQLPHYNEAQLENNWFKPIFDRLGHVWEGQPVVPGLKGGIKKPDYAFFPDAAARQQAVTLQNSADYAQTALAVGEVKAWEVHLSKKTGTQPTFDDQNPMFQIDTYLSRTGLAWGLLSNGRFWRLVHKNSSRTLETYFEIDLLAALAAPDETQATKVAAYFWLFFNQASFRPDAHGLTTFGRPFLNDALDQSRAYAVALEADLRDNAYRSLDQLITGFFVGDPTLDKNNAAHRAQVYQNSLYLLYRLLFLFYGESRALLPMNNPAYVKNYSLQQLARALNSERNSLGSLPATGRTHWNRLAELFRLISGIDPQLNADLGVPRYNGGLFDPQQHPFLEQHFVGDRYLARAIDYLAYRRILKDGRLPAFEAVDYRTLDVRQLGSIYEGMLEYKVTVAAEEMVTVSKGGVETWVPLAQKGKAKTLPDRRRPGELYLTTDKGERKATGSYYTPDYIVEYIVANTLGPLVEQARERVKAQVRQTGSLDPAERQRQSAARFVEEILRLNVLDPAMGSGHFLVEAMNFLARALATDDFVQAGDDGGHRGDDGAAGRDSETDLLYWKRRVVEACIYGVDKNPMAVELAKLSLWLKTAAADKPLSFLDHHLRHGDSLVGAWLADLARAPVGKLTPTSTHSPHQFPLFDEAAFTRDAGLAVHGMATIEALPTDSIDDVHAKETAWRAVQQAHLARWRRLADLWVSAYFGNEMTAEDYRALAAHVQGQGSLMGEAQAAPFLNHPAVTDNDYFHWELAFPEVFFDEYGRARGDEAGFDAVIGNPPYISAWSMTDNDSQGRRVIAELLHEKEALSGHWDLYVAFLIRAYEITRSLSRFAFIIPNPFCREKYATGARKFFLARTQIEKIVSFGMENVFDEVSRQTLIIIFQKKTLTSDDFFIQVDNPKALVDPTLSSDIYHKVPQSFFWEMPDYQYRYEATTASFELLKKVKELSLHLGDVCYVNYGAQVSSKKKGLFGKDDVVSYEPKGNAKKFFDGKDIARYEVRWGGRYLDYRPEHMYGPRVPELFESPKILIRDVTGSNEQLIVSYDDTQLYCDHLIICATYYDFLKDTSLRTSFEGYNKVGKPYPSLLYITAVLASKLLTWYFKQVFATGTLQGSYSHTYPQQIRAFPVYCTSFLTSKEQRTAVLTTAQSYYQQGDYSAILTLTDAELDANRNDTIHDLLAFLAEQMIAMNKEKQARLEAFWLDLEGVTESKTFATLRGKGKQAQSLYKAVPAARPFLNEASRSAIGLDASLNWNEDAFKGFVKELAGSVSGLSKVVQVYRDHAPGVAALSQRLAATDRLIDQVVYKLYGLTPAEIQLIETSTKYPYGEV